MQMTTFSSSRSCMLSIRYTKTENLTRKLEYVTVHENETPDLYWLPPRTPAEWDFAKM